MAFSPSSGIFWRNGEEFPIELGKIFIKNLSGLGKISIKNLCSLGENFLKPGKKILLGGTPYQNILF